ncbi:hypothetical protein N9M65_01755 [Luminiphilus sp.]|nr:hypothetical protein [Luminiphilus sp.]
MILDWHGKHRLSYGPQQRENIVFRLVDCHCVVVADMPAVEGGSVAAAGRRILSLNFYCSGPRLGRDSQMKYLALGD